MSKQLKKSFKSSSWLQGSIPSQQGGTGAAGSVPLGSNTQSQCEIAAHRGKELLVGPCGYKVKKQTHLLSSRHLLCRRILWHPGKALMYSPCTCQMQGRTPLAWPTGSCFLPGSFAALLLIISSCL